MNVHHIYLSILALICVQFGKYKLAEGKVQFDKENGGYHLEVVFDDTVDPDEALLENFLELVNKGSKLLYHATGNKVFYSKVEIYLPSGWPVQNGSVDYVPGPEWERADIQVLKHPSANGVPPPASFNHGKCGEQGKYIQMHSQFLKLAHLEDTPHGQPDKVLVKEWAKYRYGVFDEHGYPGDIEHPVFTYVKDVVGNICPPSFEYHYFYSIS